MKNLRKPYISMVMAMLILLVSCEQYDTLEDVKINKFDYSLFNEFKDSFIFKEIIDDLNTKGFKNKFNPSSETNEIILNQVNLKLGSNLNLPNSILKLTDYNSEKIFNTALENKWMTKTDVKLIKDFNSERKSIGFDKAIKSMKKKF